MVFSLTAKGEILVQIRREQKKLTWLGYLVEDFRSVGWAIGQVVSKAALPSQGHKRLFASSLAFKTILALVPALAILMAVLSSDAFGDKRDQLLDQIVDVIYPVQTQTDNSFFDPDSYPGWTDIYENILASAMQKGALLTNAGDILKIYLQQ